MATRYSGYDLNRNIVMHVNVLNDNESGTKLKLKLKGKEANSLKGESLRHHHHQV